MKSMLMVMALLVALTVYASFQGSMEADRLDMARKAELAQNYGHGQPDDRVAQFENKEFAPGSVLTDREEDIARTLIFGVMSE